MDLPHPVHSAIEAHHTGGEGAVGRRPPTDRLGLQGRELGQPPPRGGEGGTERALVSSPGANGGGTHVDELQEGTGGRAGFHAAKDTSEHARISKAPLTAVIARWLAPDAEDCYLLRLDLACGHRVSRYAEGSSAFPVLRAAPKAARCRACLIVLESGRLPTQAGGELLEET